jgi:hypothetical protein
VSTLTTRDEWKAFLVTHSQATGEPMLFKRKSGRARLPARAAMTVKTSYQQAAPRGKLDCTIHDASEVGLAIDTSILLTRHSTVRVELQAGDEAIAMDGTVSHCRRMGLKDYRIGVKLKLSDG